MSKSLRMFAVGAGMTCSAFGLLTLQPQLPLLGAQMAVPSHISSASAPSISIIQTAAAQLCKVTPKLIVGTLGTVACVHLAFRLWGAWRRLRQVQLIDLLPRIFRPLRPPLHRKLKTFNEALQTVDIKAMEVRQELADVQNHVGESFAESCKAIETVQLELESTKATVRCIDESLDRVESAVDQLDEGLDLIYQFFSEALGSTTSINGGRVSQVENTSQNVATNLQPMRPMMAGHRISDFATLLEEEEEWLVSKTTHVLA